MVEKAHPDDFVVGEPLVMLHIGNFIGDDLSIVHPPDVSAAVRWWWRFNPENKTDTHRLVLARNANRVLGAFRPKTWVPRPENEGRPRWGFIGEPAEMSIQLQYVGKRVPDRFRTGSNPVRYVHPDE